MLIPNFKGEKNLLEKLWTFNGNFEMRSCCPLIEAEASILLVRALVKVKAKTKLDPSVPDLIARLWIS